MKKKVTLIHGDITEFPVDALISSANKSLLGGGGLDYIIHITLNIKKMEE